MLSELSSHLSPWSFNLGDQRLNRRASQITQCFNQSDLQLGFPGIFRKESDLKAFYRFVNNPRVSSNSIIEANQPALTHYFNQRYASSLLPNGQEEPKRVEALFYQDTTYVDYTDRFHVELGYTQNRSKRENSALLHSMIACNADANPIGLIHQDFFVRRKEQANGQVHYSRRDFSERESYKWVKGLEQIQRWRQSTALPLKPIVIGDRESDSSDVINTHLKEGIDFIIRSKSDRNLELTQNGEQELQANQAIVKLHSWIGTEVSLSQGRQLRRLHSRTQGRYYEAECDINYARVNLNGIAEEISVIYLREDITTRDQSIQGAEAAEWFILTSLPVETLADVVRWLDYYTQRWPVTEDFHKVLKTGAKIEHRQFESREALERTTALLSLVSVRILSMRYMVESDGEVLVKQSSWGDNPSLVQLMPQLDKEYLQPRDRDFSEAGTIKRLMQIVARMGGHQGYARKGRPGWKTLWIGAQRLTLMLSTLERYG